ncbi:single-stranded DNA-binding protein [Achromobacter xylosoxidans]|uniref:single-stranded DNA-binding protein n=1 Tax=Alcaligenes xylosoxydans xylosoxydans TaxID=85698 RepID=UPI001F13FE12|nr:single-stranded DNA-binding protein [Achromobacter xylosoxidans]MDH0520833.1 single-stranded DNA-binding protein [Achromobacter xylosoxidans]MDH0544805.1 single-stranded DNA-binding protein [Achromobacter xylosoxidans]MDZ5615042.1 single-stranded DNA-binding protein [Achromobacter xylosoxidans]MDZ5625754.1 single-stranded DNA-binding protein [Achromobacter xylosoxidans]MDZ5685321.1 single-stranded DNA-binding protein [Achromobacter xylosoxidans]
MSNDLNRCEFIGRLGKDPEVRYSPDGAAVCNFSLAVGWKTKEKEGVEWVRIVAFGKLAEICGEYLAKGKQVYISGRMTTRKWADKETGQDRYSTEIVADQLQMLGGKGDEADREPALRPARQPQQRQQPQQEPASSLPDMDDDIPF